MVTVDLRLGDCVEVIKTLADSSVDSVVTDPPYELGFMGKGWDASGIAYSVDLWREVLRVLKPGGYLLAFGGTRTYHRMAVAIEDAGFEIRDSIHWIYGSGFPKSLDVSKAIDKAAGADREVIGKHPNPSGNKAGTASLNMSVYGMPKEVNITAPATDAAKQWSGWGTALKPAHEPIIVARKALIGTVAQNVLAHGTGAVNIDACRVGFQSDADREKSRLNGLGPVERFKSSKAIYEGGKQSGGFEDTHNPAGRWPPNIVFSHTPECMPVGTRKVKTGVAVKHRSGGKNIFSDVNKPASADQTYADADGTETVEAWDCAEGCPVAEMDRQSGTSKSVGGSQGIVGHGDSGGASRFFPVFRYQAKASRTEREQGCDALPVKTARSGMGGTMPIDDNGQERDRFLIKAKNIHPTVKPVALMRWLVRLVTPPGGVVLEPFMGSGTTGVACVKEGVRFVGIEMQPEYFEICRARIQHAQSEQPAQKELF